MSAPRQLVFLFTEGSQATMTPAFRGGKGAGLAEMAALGLPVPPGFTIATSVARAFAETGQLPKRLDGQIRRSMRAIENTVGQKFGDPVNPLLVSVRSGAPVSMPGMMDTVLNVGLRAEMLDALERDSGREFAIDTYGRFLRQFGSAVLDLPVQSDQLLMKETEGLVPDDPFEQLIMAVRAVLLSWNSDRARTYRDSQEIPDWWGTAVTVQVMAFGNRNDQSATGVVFSHDVNTGAEVLSGEFLVRAQGEDIVSGTTTPQPIAQLESWSPVLYQQLKRQVELLSDHLDSMVDVEFTIDNGKLFILQVRRATRTAVAAATFAVRRVWAGKWSKAEAVASLSEDELAQLCESSTSMKANPTQLIGTGQPAASGCAVGKVVYSSADAVRLAGYGEKVVLVRQDTSPEDLAGMLASVAVVTANGGMSCHAAVVCRQINRPAIVGLIMPTAVGVPFWNDWAGRVVSVDGNTGQVYLGEQAILGAVSSKAARLVRNWSELGVARRIVFDTVDERLSANEMLAAFYMTEAMVREARGSELEAEARRLNESVTNKIASYFASYLALAISGELRHYRGLPKHKWFMQLLAPKKNRSSAQRFMQNLLVEATVEQQVQFAGHAAKAFAETEQWSGALGGPKWAKIAETLHAYVSGVIPAGVFVDAVFDLRHNGGVLFNKHPMFTTRTDEWTLHHALEFKKHSTIREMWLEYRPLDHDNEWYWLYDKGSKARLW